MSLLEQILLWSQALKPCLRDALRRLLHYPPLTDADYDDLFALLKLQAGIPGPDNRVPEPLDRIHIPTIASSGDPIRLISLQSLKNVNRIAPGQKLAFCPTGLTVIYGDNGTGKSGYSRVLKLACRARGEKTEVLPDARLPKEHQGTPEAEFVLEANGNRSTFSWQAGSPEHPEMSALSVFDSHCARAYVDAEQDVAYIPYGLDLVENLANIVLPELSRRLQAAIASCAVDATQFKDLCGDTQVGELIARLSADTDRSAVEALATVTPEEAARLNSLTKTLKEQDPKQKAAAVRRVIGRMTDVRSKVDMAFKKVDDDALSALKQLVDWTNAAIGAEKLAITAFRSGEDLLPGTGDAAWQALFEAAREFAKEAYPADAFPPEGEEARCLLCHQRLEDGIARMKRFDDFVKDKAAVVARAKRSERDQAISALVGASLSFGPDAALAEEVSQFDDSVCAAVRAFEANIEARRGWMVASARSGSWSREVTLMGKPRDALEAVLQRLTAQADELDLVADEEARLLLKRELGELEGRQKLKGCRDLVLSAIENLKLDKALRSCQECLKTLPITNKSKEFAQRFITQALSDALQREFAALHIAHLKPRLKSRAKDGKTLHKIVLDIPIARKLTDILSEGELRVMAIASFLAELSTSGHKGGAILDDPVFSLDHRSRLIIARRLAQEAKQRQVIVFTHDTMFLAELRRHVENDGIAAEFYHLEWTTAHYAGYCYKGLPWHHQGVPERIDALEKEQKTLEKGWIPVPNSDLCDRMRNAYSHFRATIERAVETVFLNNVVTRFANYIPVKQIEKVIALMPNELAELNSLFRKASDVTSAHDPATGAQFPVPTPAELDQDIKALRKLIDDFKKRRATIT